MYESGGVGPGENGVPRGYLCPISLALMVDPVVAPDGHSYELAILGHSYERTAIAEWFTNGRTTSPVTNLPLANTTLAANHALRAAIQEYLTTATAPPVVVPNRRSPRKAVSFENSGV
jgi:hypothetical protein